MLKYIAAFLLLGSVALAADVSILDRSDVTLGTPIKVRELNGKGYYYMISVKMDDISIGHVDMDKHFKIIRKSFVAIDPAPKQTLDLTEEEVIKIAVDYEKPNQVILVSQPTLVYDKVETKVSWMVRVTIKGDSVKKTLLITPNFCYEAP